MTYEEYRQQFDAAGYDYMTIYQILLGEFGGDPAAVLDYFKSQDYGIENCSDGSPNVIVTLYVMEHSDDDVKSYVMSQGYSESEADAIVASYSSSSGGGTTNPGLPPPSGGNTDDNTTTNPDLPPPSGGNTDDNTTTNPDTPPSDSGNTDDNNTSNTTPATTAELLGGVNGCQQLLQLSGVDIAAPTKFVLTLNDIDGDSKRNEQGDMVRIVIASDKRSYACEWRCITSEQKNTILQATSSKFGHATFAAQFYNEYDEIETATFYRGTNVTIEPVLLYGSEKYYNVSFDIIEV